MNILNIKYSQLYEGCLLSSIAHAIMTNVYPDLSYEQSWDQNNYSIIKDGLRGTITFLNNNCIGAIRNEKGNILYGEDRILNMMNSFPCELIQVAQTDTLQYLLNYHKGVSVPAITSVFWCDSNGLYTLDEDVSVFVDDFILFNDCVLSKHNAIIKHKAYYNMEESQVLLLCDLFSRKIENPNKEVVLDCSQREMIPGNHLIKECIEAFQELNIRI